jgi:peroxiredoxin
MKRRFAVPAALLLFVAAAGCSKVVGIPSGGAVGQTLTEAQKFTLKSTDGSAVSLAQVLSQKKAVLLNFWATWCTYCVEEMPDLVKMQSAHESKGFTVLAVNVGETAEQASAFEKKMGLNFPVVLDTDNAVAQAYGLVGIPVSYLVNSEGKILGEYHGFTPKMVSDVSRALAETETHV